MDLKRLARDFQHAHIERPLRDWAQHEEAFVALLQRVYDAGKTSVKPSPVSRVAELKKEYSEALGREFTARERVHVSLRALRALCAHPIVFGHHDCLGGPSAYCTDCGKDMDASSGGYLEVEDPDMLLEMERIIFMSKEEKALLLKRPQELL